MIIYVKGIFFGGIMQKVNGFINKNLNLIITIFIIIQPILDLVVSLSLNVFHVGLNLGMIVRMLFLVFMSYVVFFIKGKRKYLLVYFFILLFYSLGYFLALDSNYFMSNLHGLLRIFYFPLMLMLFLNIKDIKIDNKILVMTMFIYIILIFIAVVTNTGFNSYDIAKKGSLGWFNSTNEISGIISILLPITVAQFMNKKNIVIKAVLSLIFIFVIGEIGTKTPVLSLLITFLVSFIYFMIRSLKKKNYKIFAGLLIILTSVTVTSFLVVPKTNFYKNIMIHVKYLKLDSVDDIFENDYVFDHFIFSQRITFLKNTSNRYDKASLKNKLFGIGYVNKNGKEYKAIEMDYYDVFYNHGILGFILYFSVYIYSLYLVFKNLVKKIDFKQLMEYLSLILVLILSLHSGHIITTPAVCIYVVIILKKLINNKANFMNE